MLTRTVLLRLSESPRIERLVRRNAFSSGWVRRFIAGDRMEDTVEPVRTLNAQGMLSSLDYLGENVTNEAEARESCRYYLRLLRFIGDSRLDANVSLKLTQLGLDISIDLAHDIMSEILSEAERWNQFVRIDMESSAYVDRTLDLYQRLWPRFKCVGVVIQSYLYRSDADVAQLVLEDAPVRLVKGAYQEPASLAYQSKRAVDDSFVRLTHVLLKGGSMPAIATHDPTMIAAARSYASSHDVRSDAFDFEMLYGIRRDLQRQLVRDGYRMRVYTPFGTQWYAYMMRRLAERPANLWFVARNLLRR